MFDLIPVEFYYDYYINLCLGIVIFTLLHTYVLRMEDPKNLSFIKVMGFILLVFLILYLGTRPINAVFGDTVNYNFAYNRYSNGDAIAQGQHDYFWHVFMKFMSQIVSVRTFFTICTFLYIFPMYKLSQNLFGKFWYYSFLMFVVSFSFFTYGVNGVRNGVALSLFLWGLVYRKNKIIMFLFFLLAISFHKTAMLPVLAYLATSIYNNPKVIFTGWLLTIPVSLLLGTFWINFFANIGFADDRLSGYLDSQTQGVFSSTGFRWDFLFYSSFPVWAGYYFTIKRKFNDKFYSRLLNTYLVCNGFWVLVIKANYSNRFAYLSWFMMALIIIYPLIKMEIFNNKHIVIGRILMLYFAFTYAMYFIYYK